MSHRALRHAVILACVLAFSASFSPIARADFIAAGFDLFDPLQGSQIFVPGGHIVPVVGVPITSFPLLFGNAALGDTNSILERKGCLSDSGLSGSACQLPTLQAPIQMLAMQMMSTDGSNLFFTLQSLSFGTLNVQFGPAPNSGTFTWAIDLFFNVESGSLGGPLVTSFDVNLTAGPSPWTHVAPPNAVCIPGKNCFLDGTDNTKDFFPTGTFTASDPSGCQVPATCTSIIFGTAVTTPEPTSVVTLGIASILLLVAYRRMSRKYGTYQANQCCWASVLVLRKYRLLFNPA
jgi:hypothetical protein